MQISYEEYEVEIQFHTDLWNFRKKYYHGEDRNGFWEELINSFEALHKKYGNSYFDQLLLVCVNDIERRWKTAAGNPYLDPDPLQTLYETLRRK